MESEKSKISLQIVRDIFKNSLRLTAMIWKEKKGYIIALGFLFIFSSTIPFLRSGSSGLLINELVRVVGGAPTSSYLVWLIALFVFANFLIPFLYSIRAYFSKLFYFFISEKFEIETIRKRGEIDIAIHEHPEHNDLFNKINEGGIYRSISFIDRQFFLMQNLVEVIFASIVLIISQWWILLIILIGTIPELITELRYGKDVWNIHSTRAEIRRKFWEMRSHFFSPASIIELKLFQNTSRFISIIRSLFKTFQNEEQLNERKRLKRELFSLILSQIVFGFAVVWFIMRVISGDIQVGTLTFIIASIATFRSSLSGLFGNLARQYEDGLFVNDTFRFLDIKPVVVRHKKASIINKKITPTITFENVSFQYPGTKKYVLKDFSLSIAPGEKIAIVGINGAGKTTIVKLLCRFYDPDKGRILINDIDLRNVDLESWYEQLGVIFQDYARYRLIVHEAIALGRSNERETFKRVQGAAKASESDLFIESWDKKYEQMLGKEFTDGIEPSMGQWQKLALARTFYRGANVLVLDEPTSSIDAEAEAKIFEQLEKLPSDKTVLLISHRFSTVRRANKIAVVDGGKLIEYGTHIALLKKSGTYARLFKLQAKGYK